MKSEFDKFADDYAGAVNRSIDFSGMSVEHFVKGKAAHLHEFFQKENIGRSDQVLDIGCGVGQYERLLATRYTITGIDTSSSSILEAQTHTSGATFLTYDGSDLPFESNSFRCAFTVCVVHHVPLSSRSRFINEVHRVLQPGGVFLVYEHNPWNPMTRWAVERCVFDKDAILVSRGYAVSWLQANRFSEVQSEFLFSLPPVSERMLQLDKIFRRLPSGAQYVAFGRKV